MSSVPPPLKLELDREKMLSECVRAFGVMIEDVVGADDARGYVSIVGERIGEFVAAEIAKGVDFESLSIDQTADLLVEVQNLLGGCFDVEVQNGHQIRLTNTQCPYSTQYAGRQSLCTLTSSIMGTVASMCNGQARVQLLETIAQNGACCRAVVHLDGSHGAGVTYWKRCRSGVDESGS
jgi:predicted ArsR family transcriptional regulator